MYLAVGRLADEARVDAMQEVAGGEGVMGPLEWKA